MTNVKSWLQYKHVEWNRNQHRWTFARDHYTGDILKGAELLQTESGLVSVATAIAGTAIQGYLIKRAQGETQEAYNERARLADYTNHFAAVVDALAGMLFAVEKNADRHWNDENGKGLGEEDDMDTFAGRLMRDADGNGNGWLTVWKQLATELIVVHKSWVLVDSVFGEPRIRILQPQDVVNWRYDELGLAEVVVKERVDARLTLMDEPREEDQFLVFDRSGWQRYRLGKQNETMAVGEPGTYQYTDRSGNPALPIFEICLPLNRAVGWLLAKKANAIFNMESSRDHLLRAANFPKLVLIAGDDLYDANTAALTKGSSVLQADPEGGAHTFIAPDSAPASIATEVLKRKVEEFYVTGFREYGDAARERTATEVKQDVAAGVGAFLQMLKAAVDDAENNALWRIEQLLDPSNQSFTAYVKRSDDFAPMDVNTTLTNLVTRYFGKEVPVPVGRAGKLAAARMIAELDGIKVDDAELEAAIDAQSLIGWFRDAMDVEKPAELRVELLKKILAATHLVDPEAMIKDAEGNDKKLLDAITERALEQSLAKDEADRRQAENFGGPGGAF